MALLISTPALAAPPPVGSDDWQIMHPFAEWVTAQHDNRGYWCCDIGDGRPVDAVISVESPGGSFDPHMQSGDGAPHWWVHITAAHFPDEIDHWLLAPDGKIVSGGNPTGMPIVWLLHHSVQCFAPPDGT